MAGTRPAMAKKHARDIWCEDALRYLARWHDRDGGKRLSGSILGDCGVPLHRTANPHAFVIRSL